MPRVRIYRPARTAMQSGKAKTHAWTLEYEPATRREPDPLMGWSSAEDTLNEVKLHFATLDDAIAFAKKRSLDYVVSTPHDSSFKPKAYADNFRYDRPR
jgi:hypothetical protein